MGNGAGDLPFRFGSNDRDGVEGGNHELVRQPSHPDSPGKLPNHKVFEVEPVCGNIFTRNQQNQHLGVLRDRDGVGLRRVVDAPFIRRKDDFAAFLFEAAGSSQLQSHFQESIVISPGVIRRSHNSMTAPCELRDPDVSDCRIFNFPPKRSIRLGLGAKPAAQLPQTVLPKPEFLAWPNVVCRNHPQRTHTRTSTQRMPVMRSEPSWLIIMKKPLRSPVAKRSGSVLIAGLLLSAACICGWYVHSK